MAACAQRSCAARSGCQWRAAVSREMAATATAAAAAAAATAAALPPLGELGWRNIPYDDPEVVALRQTLQAEAGIKGLEIVDPAEAGFAKRAAAIFRRDGFVIVRDALSKARLRTVMAGCEKVIRHMVAQDPLRLGSRGSHRYSFGTAPVFFGCAAHWAPLVDSPAVLEVLETIWENPLFTCTGFGGDFVLPGCTEYQELHRDMGDYLRDPSGRLVGVAAAALSPGQAVRGLVPKPPRALVASVCS
eukprot:SAG11_NODE_5766_length_1467_cov_1.391813_1_plen_246_part_00